MEFIEERSGASIRLKVVGEATIYDAAALKMRLLEALGPSEALEVDLSGAPEIDTSCVQLLILLKKEAARAGKSFKISALSSGAESVLGIYGLTGFFSGAIELRD